MGVQVKFYTIYRDNEIDLNILKDPIFPKDIIFIDNRDVIEYLIYNRGATRVFPFEVFLETHVPVCDQDEINPIISRDPYDNRISIISSEKIQLMIYMISLDNKIDDSTLYALKYLVSLNTKYIFIEFV